MYTLLNFEVAGFLPIFSNRFLRLSSVRWNLLMANLSNSSLGSIVSVTGLGLGIASLAGLDEPNVPRPELNRPWLEVETIGGLS